MNTFRSIVIMMLVICVASVGHAKIQAQEVGYYSGETKLEGYLVYDDSIEGDRPGVLVVHEWWGHNDYARKRADMLAKLGYVAFALDMYGEGKLAEHPKEAGEFSSQVMSDMKEAKQRFMAAKAVLETHPLTSMDKIAAIGYCFGGTTVINMALMGVDLAGVASFHGGLNIKEEANAEDVSAKILVLHGGADDLVDDEQVQSFKQTLENRNVSYEFVTYEGAKHSFTNPEADKFSKEFDLPLGYSQEADRKSWNKLKEFLEKIFRQ